MTGAAGALGGVAAGSAFVGPALGQTEEEDDEASVENDFEDDVAILNYALTLEYLEAKFYQEGLDNIGEEALCNCRAVPEDSPLKERMYDELVTIKEHEEQHVETLISTIESLDGEPVEEPAFDFGLAVEYPMAFLGTAVQLEDVGVSAYAGAAPDIESADLIPPALGIHSVEARHAAFLRTLNGVTSYPNVIDEARSRDEVLAIASEYIVEGEEPEPEEGEVGNETEDGTEENVTDEPAENGSEAGVTNDTTTDNGTTGVENDTTDNAS
ncbi:ferritin-like domain-containing protein [Halonotius terrestris]|uniref:Ferritin-like domain-containing protein n=2 Tax=Halonotius terrestris TaxID=2487750 RepID=A0A8J8PBH0_9EURY|nr:ferritin-like domain-containing protein [Halonotius terrestris]